MPIGPLPPGCVAVAAPMAFDATAATQVTGVCSQDTSGLVLSNVEVSGCTAAGYDFFLLPASPQSVAVVILVQIPFTFTAKTDGFSFEGSATCTDFITTVVPLISETDSFLSPPDCASELACTATPAPFDAEHSVQSFIVSVTGATTCVASSGTYTVVTACPSTTAGSPRGGGAS